MKDNKIDVTINNKNIDNYIQKAERLTLLLNKASTLVKELTSLKFETEILN